jgi:hypothetical protein
MHYFSFKRSHLAISYCDSLAGKGIVNARSGLFLAAPRRVGKSTFLIDELIPEAESREWATVYVDLWANQDINPADLIADAIKAKIISYDGRISKVAKALKLNKVNVMGTLTLDLTQSGLADNLTLTDLLRLLGNVAEQKPIMLVVDEAQQALVTQRGINAMFSIKSARDQLNAHDKFPTLMLVFTGSNRDKLAHLILKKEQPFFGSDVTSFPLLDRAFTDAFVDWTNKNLACDNQFTYESMWQAFKLTGHRPEILRNIVGRIAISGDANNFAELLESDARVWHGRIWDEFESNFNALTPLQRAILEVLITKGQGWVPFSEDSLNEYKCILGQDDLPVATVQVAIQGLRDRDFIWQSGRGAYALEDESFSEWFKHNTKKTT